MAFGRNKDEVFQRVVTVKDEPEKPVKKKKETKKKKGEEQPAPVVDTSMWGPSETAARPERIESSIAAESAPAPAEAVATESAPEPIAEDKSNEPMAVREVGASKTDNRPVIEMSTSLVDEGDITGGMYSDSGRTVTMAMRLVSYLLYICGPLYFVGKIFDLVGTEAEQMSTGFIASTIIDGVIGTIVFISCGILVVGLIKILQNLMALQKKKKKR